ncbi:hypothetical protein JCM17846_31710 [Iodidimonas nitroreducens]|uniref:Disulfide bond formation protein B n=1 Tax=Iodidimonas nitroreducens TaxID=1236968 RepID=A0A5A7NEJ7_9PROT|nr:disulfide bond formation protein B [Iodidimonas nitroreducens]GAK34021.1 disulfide bond formation protein B 2 [alpha proteobacterium Q-1]GER05489.1 hypothetical protein JCM17846_31710 [Iodidimonas nitroreducens]
MTRTQKLDQLINSGPQILLPGLLAFASAIILGAAHFFEYLGYAPCTLCHWQRIPYYLALLLPLLIFVPGRRGLDLALFCGLLLFLATAFVGGFHGGVEQGFWAGPSTCSGASLPTDPAAALEQIMKAKLVRCDDISWSFLGLSMAVWNMLIALGLAGFSGYALYRRHIIQKGQSHG